MDTASSPCPTSTKKIARMRDALGAPHPLVQGPFTSLNKAFTCFIIQKGKRYQNNIKSPRSTVLSAPDPLGHPGP